MSNILYMDLLDEILVELPKCPTAVAERAMRKAVADWFRETGAWQANLPAVLTVDGLLRYPVILPECTELLMFADLLKDDGKSYTGPNWTAVLPNILCFQSAPQADIRLTPVAMLIPARSSTGIPCEFSRWSHAWDEGALAYLRDQASQPWYSPDDAERHRAKFRSAIAGERINQNTGHRAGDLAVQPRRWM